MTQDKRPAKVPKGNVLIEFSKDVGLYISKGERKITDKAKANLFVESKKAKIIKEYSEGELAKMVKAGKDYLNVKVSKASS